MLIVAMLSVIMVNVVIAKVVAPHQGVTGSVYRPNLGLKVKQ
jgi:hypothetical protein